MSIKSFALTLGLGMVGGAAAALVLPKQPMVQQAVSRAADSIENAVEQARDAVTSCSCGMNEGRP